jgi:hypothetical protein
MARKKSKRLPPNPDPERYILVKSKEGNHYRLKRGLGKKAELNPVVQANTNAMGRASAAAKRVLAALDPFIGDIKKGRLHSRLTGKFVSSIRKQGFPVLSALKGVQMQIDEDFKAYLTDGYQLQRDMAEGILTLRLFSAGGKMIIKRGALVDSWQISMVVLYGNPDMDGELDTEHASCAITSIEDKVYELILTLPIPAMDNYMVALKVEQMEFGARSPNTKLRAMMVVG